MVYLLLADGFEDIEAIAPLDILRRGGISLQTVGVSGRDVTSSHGVSVRCDITLDELSPDADFEMLILPGGGTGVQNLSQSEAVLTLVQKAEERKKLIAAICAAPTILASAGILKERRAVCYPGLEPELTQNGARIQWDERVTHDQHIITAQAAGSALDFGLKLLAMLRGWEAAETVRRAIHYEAGAKSLT